MRPDFEVTIIGNTSSIPVHGRHHTAQVVRFAQDLLLLDCGEGTQIQLRALHIKTSRISHIFISHLHGDHYLGLVGLLSSFHLSNRKTPITIFGPQGLDDIITTQFRWSNTRLSYPLHFHQTDPDGFNLILDMQGYQVYSFPLKHRLPTTGFLIKEKKGMYSLIKEKINEKKLPLEVIQSLRNGIDYITSDGDFYMVNEYCHSHPPLRSYAFCSDTKFDPELSQYIKGVDLLYHESTFMEDLKERAELTQHSTAMQAAEIAKIAEVKKLLLGHFSSRYVSLQPMLLEAQSIFPKSILSIEGETYIL